MPATKSRRREVSFDAGYGNAPLIASCVARAQALWVKVGLPRPDRINLTMDLTACHANGCPLDFRKLLDFDDFNFAHDVGGISRHIDRSTGALGGCFLPRSAAPTREGTDGR